MGIMVPRSELNYIEKLRRWILICGRRKTGKTFLVRRFVSFDEYYFIARSGRIFKLVDLSFESISKDVFLDRLQRDIMSDKTIVIDEFHRLGEEFMDLLHALKPEAKARLILITSSLFYAEKILRSRSPLLGIVTPVRIGLISPKDTLNALIDHISNIEDAVKIALFAREPILLENIHSNMSFDEFLDRLVIIMKNIVPGLIGEIFFEESRELTERYEAIIKALATGNQIPTQISSYLSGLLDFRFTSSDIKSYLKNLMHMGIVRRYKIYGRKRYYYMLDSPLIDAYFYLNDKLGYGEVDIPHELVIEELKKLVPKYFEQFILDLIAEVLGGNIEKVRKNEIDGIITSRNKTIASLEIKMGLISVAEAYKFLEKIRNLNLKTRNIIIAKNKIKLHDIISLNLEDITQIAKTSKIREFS